MNVILGSPHSFNNQTLSEEIALERLPVSLVPAGIEVAEIAHMKPGVVKS